MHNLSIRGLGGPGGRQWRRHNDLDALAGTWSAADAAEFERAPPALARSTPRSGGLKPRSAAMRPILIGTNTYTAFKRGDADILEVFACAETLLVNSVELGQGDGLRCGRQRADFLP